jgi:UbiD family decarboxylase
VADPTIVDNKDAPCKQNKWVGDDIDLEKIPAPLQHRGDAERMMQSCGLNICQTPDGKWTNWSVNRSALHDKKTMKGFWLPNQRKTESCTRIGSAILTATTPPSKPERDPVRVV